MPISNDLFLAILAMDSYNRGYNEGIKLPENAANQIGRAEAKSASDILRDANENRRDKAASFYAQSYTWNIVSPTGDGPTTQRTVIAYRGTDTEFFSGPDFPAFSMGFGNYETAQGNLAIDFYKKVNNGNAATNANITVVGHSLGGGLAGYVGSLYGLQGRLFDNMAFEAAAGGARSVSVPRTEINQFGVPETLPPNLDVRQRIYGSNEPWTVNKTGLRAEYFPGEFVGSYGDTSSIA